MDIGWYPGHMHKAQKEIRAVISRVDLVFELVDARLPQSSHNPLLKEICEEKPIIKLLNKCDLADPKITALWLTHFKNKKIAAFAVEANQQSLGKKMATQAQLYVPKRGGPGQPIRAMIIGIPNVGKSTLMNTLAKKRIARVGDQPAVTKGQQRIKINNLLITDTPGVLWPKLADKTGAIALGISGAIRDPVLEIEGLACAALEYLVSHYDEAMRSRYKLDNSLSDPLELLLAIGKKRGCLLPGGVIDKEKSAYVVLRDLRAGRICRISLERP